MYNTFVTSDLHFNHDREFIYKPRGFSSVEEMNEAIIKNWNSVVKDEDIVYVLGDLMLGDNKVGIELFNRLNGFKEVIIGNHDTPQREEEAYSYLKKTMILGTSYILKSSYILKYGGYKFFLCHYPVLCNSLENDLNKRTMINLYGHTHQKTNFYNGNPYMYHVGVDSHNCTPVHMDQVIADIKKEVAICKSYL